VQLFSVEINFKELLKNNQGVKNCETLLELSKIKAVARQHADVDFEK